MINNINFKTNNLLQTYDTLKDYFNNVNVNDSLNNYNNIINNTVIHIINNDDDEYNKYVKKYNNINGKYKRINHLMTWLICLQSKQKYVINNDIINNIRNNIDMNNINYDNVRQTLKKLHYNKYYKYIPYIIYKLNNNNNVMLLTQNNIIKIKNMFNYYNKCFCKLGLNRKFFLYYSFVLRKIFEQLELYEYIKFLPSLKNKKNIETHENIFNIINNKN